MLFMAFMPSGEGNRGAEEIATCVLKFIEKKLLMRLIIRTDHWTLSFTRTIVVVNRKINI
jgi:hypothetical protein